MNTQSDTRKNEGISRLLAVKAEARMAGLKVTQEGHLRAVQVLQLIRHFPDRTTAELLEKQHHSDIRSPMSRYEFSDRARQLHEAGRVARGGQRMCYATQHIVHTWLPAGTPDGH